MGEKNRCELSLEYDLGNGENIIGLDIDGVILDFERVIRCYAELYDLLWLKKDGKVNDDASPFKAYDWTKEELQAFKDYYLIYGTRKAPLMTGVREVLTLLRTMGYKIVLITSRGGFNPRTIEEVRMALDKYFIPFDEIYYKQDNKVELAKQLGIRCMIDDNPDVITSIASVGIPCLYFRDKFSKEIDMDNVTEVSNWGEILRILMRDNLDKDVIKKVFPSPRENI